MANVYSRSWWGMALRGLLSILFGIAIFVWPGISLLALVTLFGAFAFVDGAFALMNAFKVRAGHRRWWALLLEGLVGIAVGILTLIYPGITAVALLYLIAAWAIVTGVLEIIAAIKFRDDMDNEWLMGLAGLASIILGILLAIQPAAGITALLYVIGAYAVVFGVLMLIAGLRARGYADRETLKPA